MRTQPGRIPPLADLLRTSALGCPAACRLRAGSGRAGTNRETSRRLASLHAAARRLPRTGPGPRYCTASGRRPTRARARRATALAVARSASSAIHVDIDIAAAVIGRQTLEKSGGLSRRPAAEVKAVNARPAPGRLANDAELAGVRLRIAAVGEQKDHLWIQLERG